MPNARESDRPLTVALQSEDPLARAGLLALLREAEGVELVTDHPPADVVLWDLGANPTTALERLGRANEAPPILALVPDEDTAAEAIAAGARGVLDRTADPTLLEAALRAIHAGLFVTDHGLGRIRTHSDAPPPPLLGALTPREIEVLKLLAEGLSNKAIAQRLEISEHTAKFHVNAILQKLGVDRRTEAVVRAARLGLVML